MSNKLLNTDFIETLYSALLVKFKSLIGKPDWNQNDKTSKNFIKNRTHYDTRKMVTNGIDIVLDNPEGKEKAVYEIRSYDDEIRIENGYLKISEKPLTLEELKSCEYKWSDEVEYCRIEEQFIYVEENLINYDYCILSVFEETEFKEGEEYETITLTKGLWVCFSKIGDSYDYLLSNIRGSEYETGELKQLDKKYLPHLSWKDIAHHIDGKVIYEENALNFENGYTIYDILPNTAMLEEGRVYTVIFCGVEYKCLAKKDGYNDIYIGNQSIIKDIEEWEFPEAIKSNEPFFIATYKQDNWSIICVNRFDTSTYSISISDESYDRIDEKYLPSSSADWNTLQNKPFYSEFIGGYIMHENDINCYKYDSHNFYYNYLDKPIVLNGTLELESKYTIVFDGVEYTATLYEDEGGRYFGINYYYGSNPDSLPFGMWFSVYDDFNLTILCANTSGWHTVAIKGVEEVIHKIDKKYLPSEITELPYDLQNTKEKLEQKIDKKKTEVQEELATAMQEVDNTKMDKSDPEGTGTFSVNRAQESTVGYCSSAVGKGVVANGRSSFVCGEFNKDKIYVYNKTFYSVSTTKIKFPKNKSFYYSREYIYNEETGIFTLINPSSISAEDLVNSSPSELVDFYFVSNNVTMDSGITEGSMLYRILMGYKTVNNTYSTYFGYSDEDNYFMRYVRHEYSTRVDKNSERTDYAYTVGNGTDDENRSNAHTLDWEGNAWYAKDVYVGSFSGTNKDNGSEKLARMSDLPGYIDKEISFGPFTAIGQAWDTGVVFKSNTNYLVVFNGVEYYVTTNERGYTEVSEEYPFQLVTTDDGDCLIPTNEDEEYTYTLYEIKGIHQIEEKFIPDTIARVSDINTIKEMPIFINNYANNRENALLLESYFKEGKKLKYEGNDYVGDVVLCRREYDDATGDNSIVFYHFGGTSNASDLSAHWMTIDR